MPTISLISNVSNGTAPFTYNYQTVDGCGDITFTDPDGNEGVNEITFTSENPIVTIQATFEEEDCENDEVLAMFSLSVNAADELCTATTEVSKNNPCYEFTGSLSAGTYNGQTQEVTASVGNGNFPFTYVFETDLVITSQDGNKITVVRTGVENSLVSVAITDANGCVANVELNLPPANQNPTLENFSIQLNCDNVPAVLDIVALAADVDGVIDLATIEIIQTPTKGTAVIDASVGIITYTATALETGTDTFSYRVRDNNGNYSNLAVANIVITPCLEAPVAVADSYTIDCETSTTVTPVSNDTDADGFVDGSTVTILTQPFHGTTALQSNGDVIYTPDAGFEGADYFRYLVRDNDGLVSNIGLVSITVGDCCDAHSASMNIACSDGPLLFTATNTEDLPGITSNTIEVDDGTGYVVGNSGTLVTDCSEVSEVFVNTNYTQLDGTFFAPNELAGDLTITPLGGSNFRIRFDFDEPHSPSFITALRAFMLNCGGVWRLSGTLFPVTNFSLIKDNISAFTGNSLFMQFDYLNVVNGGVCATEVNAEVNNLSNYLISLGVTPSTTSLRWLQFECLTFGTATGTLKFRRTVVRPGCPDIVIEFEIILNDINDPCNNYTINVLQDGGGTGTIAQSLNCEASVDISNSMTLTDIIVDGTNILTTPQLFDDNGIQTLEVIVQDFLDANGGGTAVITVSTNMFFIQILNKDGSVSFDQIETNDSEVGLFNDV